MSRPDQYRRKIPASQLPPLPPKKQELEDMWFGVKILLAVIAAAMVALYVIACA